MILKLIFGVCLYLSMMLRFNKEYTTKTNEAWAILICPNK